jgi:hypothetical protein
MPAAPRRGDAAKPKSIVPVVVLFVIGAGMAVLLFGAAIVAWLVLGRSGEEPAPPTGPGPQAQKTGPSSNPGKAPEPPRKAPAWWAAMPNASIAQSALLVQAELPQEQPLFDRIGDAKEPVRLSGYRDLVAKLPELVKRPEPRRLLGRFISDCCALEPVDANEAILQSWLIKQLPEEDAEFAPTLTANDLERSFWALEVSLDAVSNASIKANRRQQLAESLSTAFGFAVDTTLPAGDLKKHVAEQLARRCYRKLPATAEKSLDRALTLRDMLLRTVPEYLEMKFRTKRDTEIAINGLAQASKQLPLYSDLLRDCLKSDDQAIQLAIVELYAEAAPPLASQFEPLLAIRWSAATNPKLDQPAKVRQMRKALGIPDPAERLEVLAKVAKNARAVAADPANKRVATLQETVRLAHASTLACALWQQGPGLVKFDEMVAKVPEITRAPEVANNDPPKKNAADPAGPDNGAPIADRPITIRGALTPAALKVPHQVKLKRGRSYAIFMHSGFDNYLYLYDARGALLAQDDDSGGGLNAMIRFTAPADALYRVVASSFGGRRIGAYTITISEMPPGAMFFGKFRPPPRFPGFPPFGPPPGMPGPGFKGPPGNPGMPPPAQPKDDAQPQIDQADLSTLAGNNPSEMRIGALHRIVTKLASNLARNDLTARQAQTLARYLLTIKTNAELEEVLPKIAPLAKSRAMLLALADRVEQDAEQSASEGVVGAIVQQSLRFAKDDNWRLACRKLLLQQAVDVSARTSPATQTAEVLRGLYTEQAVLLGIAADSFKDLAQPSQVLDKLIEHVMAKLGEQPLAEQDKQVFDQIKGQRMVAQYLAQNDLERTVLLQRVWVRILPIYLAQRVPDRADQMRKVHDDLLQSDRTSRTVLEQLHAGEEKTLRIWALALNMK